MTQTNPTQATLELVNDILNEWRSHGIIHACTMLQAAFAERESRLVALLKRAQENMPGSYIHWHDDATAALKDRTHG